MNNDTIPPELEEALRGRPPDEQRRVRAVWALLDDAEAVPEGVPDDAHAWAALQEQLASGGGIAGTPRRVAGTPRFNSAVSRRASDRGARRSRALGWRVGAPVVGLVVMLLAVWGWRRPVVERVPEGARRAFVLPDGSHVQLGGGSSLTYRRGFAALPAVPAAGRVVHLTGQAFFEVQRDGRPFAVETRDARVEVLGTRFDVRALPDDGATRVVLDEGRVRVVAGDQAVVLSRPGEAVRAGAEPLAVAHVELQAALAWRNGGYAALDESVRAILADLRRAFGVHIRVEGPLDLDRRVSLVYHEQTDAGTVIHDLCLSQGCSYRATDAGFVLSAESP